MAEVFTVSASDASTMQRHYEQMIEALLRALLDKDAKQDKNKSKGGLKIFDGDRLVYGREQNQFRDEISGLSGQLLNPQLVDQLQQLRSTPVGGVVESAANKRVELDGQVVLQSDEHGRVTVNTLLTPNRVQNTTPQPMEQVQQSKVQPNNNSTRIDTQNTNPQPVNPVQQSGVQPNNESTRINTQNTNPQPVNQIREKEVQVNKNSSTIDGSKQVMQSLQSLEDSPLKTLLENTLHSLQVERQALQEERKFYQTLIDVRLQQPQNSSWWQQAKNNVLIVIGSTNAAFKMAVQEFREHSAKHQGAASLKALFHRQTRPGVREYQTPAYQISYNGSTYEVLDLNSNKQIMQFRSTPLGVKIEKENLNPKQIKDIEDLRNSLERNEPIPTPFNSVGKQEAEYLNRVNNIANALVQYATVRQENVQIDGRFSYKWQASPDGKVGIEAKDGRGILLKKDAGGKLISSMSEQDLTHFEQVLSNLNLNNSASLLSQKTENKELSR